MRRKGHEHMIAIIDYDAGNIKSVEKAMHLLGQEVVVTRDRESILKADKVILPGVGAFGDAMSKIRQYNLEEVIHEVVEKGTPFLGICLGLQLLFERSDETPGVEGLGILKGEILRIPDQPGLKIPHMGWKSLPATVNWQVETPFGVWRSSGSEVSLPIRITLFIEHAPSITIQPPSDLLSKSDYLTVISERITPSVILSTRSSSAGKSGADVNV